MRTEQMLKPGYVLAGGKRTYIIEKVLGSGGFGITYKVKSRVQLDNIPTDVSFAVKEYFPDKCWRGSDSTTLASPPTMQHEVANGIKDFINEALRLQRTCHLNSNIVNVNEVFRANGTAYYVLEYLDGGDLRKMVKDNGGGGVDEQQMLKVMIPVGLALQCLHENKMLHLDIKPDNIVMRRNSYGGSSEPVLIDFGLATHFDYDGAPTTSTPTSGITPGYSPLEQYAHIKQFDPRLDIYAFSATCLYLLTGQDPGEAMNLDPGYVRSMMPSGVSEEVVSAIERGMSFRKEGRPGSMREMLDMLGYELPHVPHLPLEQPPHLPSEQPPHLPMEQPPVFPEQQPLGQQYEQPSNFYEQSGSTRRRRLQQRETPPKRSVFKTVLIYVAIVVGVILLVAIFLAAISDDTQPVSKPKHDNKTENVENEPSRPERAGEEVNLPDRPTGNYEKDADKLIDKILSLYYSVETQEDIDNLEIKSLNIVERYEAYYEKKGAQEKAKFDEIARAKMKEREAEINNALEYVMKKEKELVK